MCKLYDPLPRSLGHSASVSHYVNSLHPIYICTFCIATAQRRICRVDINGQTCSQHLHPLSHQQRFRRGLQLHLKWCQRSCPSYINTLYLQQLNEWWQLHLSSRPPNDYFAVEPVRKVVPVSYVSPRGSRTSVTTASKCKPVSPQVFIEQRNKITLVLSLQEHVQAYFTKVKAHKLTVGSPK